MRHPARKQDPTKAYNALLTLAQANPELGAVFIPEANSALGAAQAAKELGGNDLAVVTSKNADSFHCDAYLTRRGAKGIEE